MKIYVGFDSQEIIRKAKAGERFVIIQKKVGSQDLSLYERPSLGFIQTSKQFEAENWLKAFQEQTFDTLLLGEINTYLEIKDYVFFQNVSAPIKKVINQQEWRWFQREGFDYCLIDPQSGEFVSNEGVLLYLHEEKAEEWKAKGYTAVKVGRYLANDKPVITYYL